MTNFNTVSEAKDNRIYTNETQSFRESPNQLKKSTTSEFFKTLYNYPPNFRLNVHPTKDEESINITKEKFNNIQKKKYNLSDYVKGIQNRTATSGYFNKFSKKFNSSENIPIYVVLNSWGEIVLAKPVFGTFNQLVRNPLINIKEQIYNSCGAFEDVKTTRESKLGLFFLTEKDAENYMREIISKDKSGASIAGVSVNCINLLSAYKLMCDHHPSIDFRFIPSLQTTNDVIGENSYNKKAASVFNPSANLLSQMKEKSSEQNNLDLNHYYWDNLDISVTFEPKVKSFLKEDTISRKIWSGVPFYIIEENFTDETVFHIFDNYSDAESFKQALDRKWIIGGVEYKGYTCIKKKKSILNWAESIVQKDELSLLQSSWIINPNFYTEPIWKNNLIQLTSLENLFEYIEINAQNSNCPRVEFFDKEQPLKEEFRLPFLKKYRQDFLKKCRLAKSLCSTLLYR